MTIRRSANAPARWAAVLVCGVILIGLTGCQISKETIAPDAGKPLSAAEKADEAKRAASGKM